jgi:hypothetical protein
MAGIVIEAELGTVPSPRLPHGVSILIQLRSIGHEVRLDDWRFRRQRSLRLQWRGWRWAALEDHASFRRPDLFSGGFGRDGAAYLHQSHFDQCAELPECVE